MYTVCMPYNTHVSDKNFLMKKKKLQTVQMTTSLKLTTVFFFNSWKLSILINLKITENIRKQTSVL